MGEGENGRVGARGCGGLWEDRRQQTVVEAVLASTKDFVYAFDRKGKYIYANDALLRRFEQYLGLKAEDVMGRDFYELGYPRELADKYRDQIEGVITAKEVVRDEEFVTVPTGEVRQYEYIFTPVFGEHGEVEAVAGITRDVTELRDTVAALRESEDLYRTLFESVDQGVGLLEVLPEEEGQPLDIRWIEVNEAFERASGISDASGRRGREIGTEGDEEWFEIHAEVANSGEARHFEKYAAHADRWFDVHAVPVGGVESRRVAVLFSDITERKRRAENVALLDGFNEIFSRLSDPDEIMDEVGWRLAEHLGANRVTFSEVDDQATEMQNIYEWAQAGLKSAAGRHRLSGLMSDRFIAELNSGEAVVIDDIATDERTSPFLEAYRSFGVGSAVYVPHLSDGRWKFLLAIHHDHRHRWRDDEVDLVCELTGRLWWRLERAYAEEALRKANRRKDRFLAVLSHELRNPLAPIELSLAMLEQVPPDSDEHRHARRVIGRQVKQMVRLVDDLLDVNRIDNDKIHLHRESLDLNGLVERTVEDHRPLFDEKGLNLSVRPAEEPVYVRGDANRLAQVIGNLLQNAVKFTEPGGGATVTVESNPGEERARIGVADTGKGMDPMIAQELFEPFVQADTTLEHSVGGLGLGLALVKGLVELHGGEVSVSSEGLGKGAEFVVSLPLHAEAATSRAAKTAARDLLERPKILLIEDKVDVAEMLQKVLELKGFRVEVAHSGTAGLEMATDLRPDVVICDIGLPGMDGYEVAQRICKDAAMRSTKLIALSGYASPSDVERSRLAGFDHHMAKPPDMDALEEILSSG